MSLKVCYQRPLQSLVCQHWALVLVRYFATAEPQAWPLQEHETLAAGRVVALPVAADELCRVPNSTPVAKSVEAWHAAAEVRPVTAESVPPFPCCVMASCFSQARFGAVSRAAQPEKQAPDEAKCAPDWDSGA